MALRYIYSRAIDRPSAYSCNAALKSKAVSGPIYRLNGLLSLQRPHAKWPRHAITAMAVKDGDIVSMVLQAKREHEALLRQNECLRTRCHALEIQCERLKEDNDGLHTGESSPVACNIPRRAHCYVSAVYPAEPLPRGSPLSSLADQHDVATCILSAWLTHPCIAPHDGDCVCAAVDRFHEGCRQTIEASKRLQQAVTELAEAREELAKTSTALAQAQQEIKLLRQGLVGL